MADDKETEPDGESFDDDMSPGDERRWRELELLAKSSDFDVRRRANAEAAELWAKYKYSNSLPDEEFAEM